MNYKSYSTLKAANKVVFKKDVNDIYLEKKAYNADTGEERLVKESISLAYLESQKTRKTAEKTALETELTELDKIITDVKAL